MKLNRWKLLMAAAIVFIIVAIINIFESQFISTMLYLLAGLLFMISSFREYRQNKK